ncbi:uncharacterized protein LOC142341796 [Convolutriloba macropyga]|uniref:uncharacterized protein LOC142341796 n=1 Tax=Convolutriloba macropyga TaxID=536237 RepID=UPI003F5269F0
MVMNLGQIFVLASVISPLFGNEISFHNTSALDGIERLYLRSLEKAYPFLVPVDVNFIPDDSKTIHEKTAGVSVNIYPNRITISAQNTSDAELKEVVKRAEALLKYSRTEAVRQVAADLYCLLNYKSLHTWTIFIESFRFAWSPVVTFLGLVSSAGLLFLQHVIVGVASLPNVGDIDSSKSELVKSIAKKYPQLRWILSLLLFCSASIFYSAVAALVFCLLLFLYQQCQIWCAKRKGTTKTGKVTRSERVTEAVFEEESVYISSTSNGAARKIRTTRTTPTKRSQK